MHSSSSKLHCLSGTGCSSSFSNNLSNSDFSSVFTFFFSSIRFLFIFTKILKLNTLELMSRHIPRNYLKYYRVIRYFFCTKYKITYPDLELLFFLYSEKYFSREDFDGYNELFSWNEHKFYRLTNDGWIDTFRKKENGKRTIYKVSYKGARMIESFYKKLAGEEIPESPSSNPLFLKNVKYTDKVYRNMIKEMNSFIRQQRYLSPE